MRSIVLWHLTTSRPLGAEGGKVTESDSRRNRALIRLFSDYINSGANHFTYLASDCQAVLWGARAA